MTYKLCIPAIAVLLVAGCATPEQKAAHDNLVAVYGMVTEDGTVTDEERALLEDAAKTYADEVGGTDWQELLATGLGTLLASVLGVNWMRNRGLPGTIRKK